MPIKQVDKRMISFDSPFVTGNSYITNLTSVSVSSTNVFAGNIYVDNTLKNINWDSTYTTVQANSASWATDSTIDTGVRSLTGNWQDTFTTVQTNSASWVNPLSSLTWSVSAPTLSSDSGSVGSVAYDLDFFYVAVSANTWKRTSLTTF
jgi:hypothetical protein